VAARAGVQQRWQGCRFPPRAATRAPYYRSCGSFSKKPTRLRTLAVALVRGRPGKTAYVRAYGRNPCGRPAVAVWADLTPMGLVPHNGSMPHATPARCKHPRPTTVRTSPPKNLPVQVSWESVTVPKKSSRNVPSQKPTCAKVPGASQRSAKQPAGRRCTRQIMEAMARASEANVRVLLDCTPGGYKATSATLRRATSVLCVPCRSHAGHERRSTRHG